MPTTSSRVWNIRNYKLDSSKQRALSDLIIHHDFTLEQVVELVRGESPVDPRPNKALAPQRLHHLLEGNQHREVVCSAALFGLNPEWSKYWKSSRRFRSALSGAKPKANTDPKLKTRLIHDLSYPAGKSTKDASDKSSFPEVRYRHVTAIAMQIEALYVRDPTTTVYIMKGGVKGVFRHLMLVARSVMWMGPRLKQLGGIIIDMSTHFWWTGSPAYYGSFGGAISWLFGRESPATMGANTADTTPFFAYEWVDDHVQVEPDTSGRLEAANAALRLAMMAVLGPRAINENKFSEWSTKVEVLGLEFDTIGRTVEMPKPKLSKAQNRVRTALTKAKISKHEMQCLLGSLRHVSTCLRSAKPFYQRLQKAVGSVSRWGSIKIDDSMRRDLEWCDAILTHGRWWSLPTSMFCVEPTIDIHLYMDSSNQGLAILDPARRHYIHLKYDEGEQNLIENSTGSDGFNINAREQLSSIAIGFTEVTLGFRISAGHLQGACNLLADSGSRAWTAPYDKTWTNFTSSWIQDPISDQALHLHNVLNDLQARSLATDSHHKYAGTWKAWTDWCNEQGFAPWLAGDNPNDSHQLALFAVSRWLPHNNQPGNAPSTVLSKLSQVSWHHRRYRGITVGLHAGHQLAVQGMLRVSRPPNQKEPVTPRILRHFRKSCNFSTAHDRVLWGAALMGYIFLLRRSEYLADKGRIKAYPLQYADVVSRTLYGRRAQQEYEAASVRVKFRGSKNDQRGKGETRILERSGVWWACPVRAAWLLITHQQLNRISCDEPICSVDEGTPITASDMTKAIKLAAAAAGDDPNRYDTHSMRSGGSTALFTAGVDRLAIEQFGRWKSDAYEGYTRIDGQTLSGLATSMISDNHSNSILRQAQLHLQNGATPGWTNQERLNEVEYE